jgi:hypothetical protein
LNVAHSTAAPSAGCCSTPGYVLPNSDGFDVRDKDAADEA